VEDNFHVEEKALKNEIALKRQQAKLEQMDFKVKRDVYALDVRDYVFNL